MTEEEREAAVRANFRSSHIMRKYNMTPKQYAEKHKSQNGCCAICRKPETSKYKGTLRQLVVDHCHVTGKIRDLLCFTCNTGVGQLQDSPQTLRLAASYIEAHQ